MASKTPEEWARWARRQNLGYIDQCAADLVGSGDEATALCQVCEAIERVATLAVRAALRQ